MLQLSIMKRFFDSVDSEWRSPLAAQVLSPWSPDAGTVKLIRASANIVCIFQRSGAVFAGRINLRKNRTPVSFENEAKFLRGLDSAGISVSRPVAANSGSFVVEADTELGPVVAMAFEYVKGESYEIDDLPASHFEHWGASLGRLHTRSREFASALDRPTLSDLVIGHRAISPDRGSVEDELVSRFVSFLQGLPGPTGPIHFDFELDNLIWTGETPVAIDFDDAVVGPYVADITFALRDIFEGSSSFNFGDTRFVSFMNGYRQHNNLSDEQLSLMPEFYLIHAYILLKRLDLALDLDDTEHQPDWLIKLNEKLQAYRNKLLLRTGLSKSNLD
jgi:Ser/Thr protein kinase RdoA (MazF antagonist)